MARDPHAATGMTDFHSLLIQCAKEEGFPLAGALDLDTVLNPSGDFQPHIDRYDEWLSRGFDGAMSYLRRGRDRRADPRIVFPEARSILCVAMPYPALPAGEQNASRGPRYARYLRRRDYHDDIAERLERVMNQVAERWREASPETNLKWKVCVDTSAVLERSWAALAGLGWIGKNSLLIHPQYGSYLFLAEALISEPTGHGPNPLKNYCGNCTRCLNACPTQAFVQPGMVDSTRCISYWTLEKRGDLPITEEQKRSIGSWIAGCDICQEVCPFNTKVTRAATETLQPEARTRTEHPSENDRGQTVENGATALQTWNELLEETSEQYKSRIRDSSLSRVKPQQFSRNLAIALANAIKDDPNGAWIWPLKPLILKRLDSEDDPDARAAWVRCWHILTS